MQPVLDGWVVVTHVQMFSQILQLVTLPIQVLVITEECIPASPLLRELFCYVLTSSLSCPYQAS